MTTLDKAIVAHLDIHGKRFEIFVDEEKAFAFREGHKKDFDNVVVVEELYTNARKAERPTGEEIRKAFGTTDFLSIAQRIVREGELQITTERRRKLVEEKRKKIVAILSRECIDPRTGAPHPMQRIENALEEARIHLDPFKPAEQQLDEVIKQLRPLLPMKFHKVRIAVRIQPEFAHRSYGVLKEYGIQQEEWQQNGALIAVVEIPAGIQDEFYGKLNRITGGTVETKVLSK